jgi:hypothetical protein
MDARFVRVHPWMPEGSLRPRTVSDNQTQPQHDHAVTDDLIYAGLEALQAALPVGLCAYVHKRLDEAPSLFMVSPSMAETDPNEAFALFSELREAVDTAAEGQDVALGGFLATLMSTRGPRSRGLHVVGRRTARLDVGERAIFERLARGIGTAVHVLESARARSSMTAGQPLRVSVDLLEGRARAEVVLAMPDDELRTGAAESSSAGRAVVSAVLDAVDTSLKVVETTEGSIGGERAMLVLLTDQLERTALGAALVARDGDALQATASATLDAARRLPSEVWRVEH